MEREQGGAMWQLLSIILFTTCLAPFTNAQDYGWDVTMPIDEYVHSDDGYFEWNVLQFYRYDNISVTTYVVNMTSQKWLNESFSDRPVWWHIMGIAIPDEISHPDAGFLWLDAGNNNDPDSMGPEKNDIMNVVSSQLAYDLGCVAGYILQIPNQPLVFTRDPEQKRRYEDQAIAYTWWSYIFDEVYFEVPEIILRFPMAKAGKKGLDCIAEVAKLYRPETDIQRFGLMGLSKRGWTTWTLTATEPRVYAQMPIVMSLLNYNPVLHAHYQALGNWSFAFEDYYEMGLTAYIDDPRTNSLFDHEDMFRYRSRYAGRPTLVAAATGDEFFMPQDFNYWWQDMPEPKWIHMFPNAEHYLIPYYRKLYGTGAEFFNAILNNIELPSVSWSVSYDDQDPSTASLDELITYSGAEFELQNVTLYSATTFPNDTRRDYRLATGTFPYIHPVRWYEYDIVKDQGSGSYQAEVEGVSSQCRDPSAEEEDENTQWVGFFIQNLYRGALGYDTFFCTEVFFTPNCLPYPDCIDKGCYGSLV